MKKKYYKKKCDIEIDYDKKDDDDYEIDDDEKDDDDDIEIDYDGKDDTQRTNPARAARRAGGPRSGLSAPVRELLVRCFPEQGDRCPG